VHRLRSVGTPVHPTFRICPPPLAGRGARAALHTVAPDIVHVQGHSRSAGRCFVPPEACSFR